MAKIDSISSIIKTYNNALQRLFENALQEMHAQNHMEAITLFKIVGNECLKTSDLIPNAVMSFINIAEIYRAMGDYDNAIPWYLRARNESQKALYRIRPTSLCELFLGLGSAYIGQSMPHDAQLMFQQAAKYVDVASRTKPRLKWDLLLKLGSSLKAQKKDKESLRLLGAASELALVLDDVADAEKAYTYYLCGEAYYNLSELDKAASWLLASLKESIPTMPHNPKQHLNTLRLLSNIYYEQGVYDKSTSLAREMANITLQSANLDCVTTLHSYLCAASLLNIAEGYDASESWYKYSLDQVNKLEPKDKWIGLYVLAQLATMLNQSGIYDEAERVIQQAYNLYAELNDPSKEMFMIQVYLQHGILLRHLWKHCQSISTLQRAVTLAERYETHEVRCQALFELASAYSSHKEIERSLDTCRAASQLIQDGLVKDALTRSSCFTIYALSHIQNADAVSAQRCLGVVQRELLHIDKGADLARLNYLAVLTELNTLNKDRRETIKSAYEAALQIERVFYDGRGKHGIANMVSRYGRIYADGLLSSLLGWFEDNDVAFLRSALYFSDAARCLSIKNTILHHRYGDQAESQSKEWFANGFVFTHNHLPPKRRRNSIRVNAIRSRPLDARKLTEQKHDTYNELERKPLATYNAKLEDHTYANLLHDNTAVYVLLTFNLERLVVLIYGSRSPISQRESYTVSTDEKGHIESKVLNPLGASLLAKRTMICNPLLIESAKLKLSPVIAAQEEYLQSAFLNGIHSSGTREKEERLLTHYKNVYDILSLGGIVSEIEMAFGNARELNLTVIPDGPLLNLPLHAVKCPDGEYLYEKFRSMKYGLSLATLSIQTDLDASLHTKRSRSPEIRGVVFSNSCHHAPGMHIPGAADEVAEIIAETSPANWLVYSDVLGEQYKANRANHRRYHGSGNVLWHIGHGGFADVKTEGRFAGQYDYEEPAFYLEDGLVSVSDMTSRQYDYSNVELVHNSCCLVGKCIHLGELYSKEIVSYQTVMSTLGCRRVVSSLWELPDASAPVFTSYWIREIRNGPFKKNRSDLDCHAYAKAFRRAVDQFRRHENAKYDHLLFWAPYMYYGIG